MEKHYMKAIENKVKKVDMEDNSMKEEIIISVID